MQLWFDRAAHGTADGGLVASQQTTGNANVLATCTGTGGGGGGADGLAFAEAVTDLVGELFVGVVDNAGGGPCGAKFLVGCTPTRHVSACLHRCKQGAHRW